MFFALTDSCGLSYENYEFLTRNADVLSEAGSFYDVKSSHVHFAESLLLNYLLVADPDITFTFEGPFCFWSPNGIVDVKRQCGIITSYERFRWTNQIHGHKSKLRWGLFTDCKTHSCVDPVQPR